MSSQVHDKGGGNVDWETHSLKYVVNAIASAQKRQQKLWNQLLRTRKADGTIAVDWPPIEEYVEAVRRTHALMIDLETVGNEYQTKFSRGRPAARGKKAAAKKARRKKAVRRK
ncbi:MAG: hypothetical protein L6Q83_04020 [Gammaproteobacteria bacterium]|jgi:hypothetical protein|nr:hypothetical protein [Gammaproteobacteria bacterium]